MRFVIVIFTTIIAPLVSILIARNVAPDANGYWLIGKWFVFWGVGVHVLAIGLLRAARMDAAARGGADERALRAGAELGFANIGLGLAGVVSFMRPEWIAPVSFAAAIYFALAALQVVVSNARSARAWASVIGDVVVLAALVVYLLAYFGVIR